MLSFTFLLALAVQDPVQEMRAVVERSLPFLEKKGVEWKDQRKCSSCHHVTFMLWSFREAGERGFAVDAGKLDGWTNWAVELARTATNKEGQKGGQGLDTMVQLILARSPKADEAPYRELAEIVRGMQKADGSWPAGGQLPSQRRDKIETDEVTTMWTLLAFQSLTPDSDATRDKALAWLESRKPGPSVESLALQLLVDRQLGKGTRTEPLLKELLARQNEDGGWGWLKGEPSDALGTGQVLYVLSRVGGGEEAVRRAWKFLARTQKADGSWTVPSTKPTSKDLSMAAYWGTGWSTIGILRTLPR